MNLAQILRVDGLPPDETELLNDLVKVWRSKLSRNRTRQRYYEGKNKLKDLGISVPPPLKKIETVVGWPAKAVDALAVRSMFDGFVVDSGEETLLSTSLEANRFKSIYHQAVTSELISSCAFLTVSRGEDGEPPVILSAYSAHNAAALWDDRHKRIRAGLAVIDVDRRYGRSDPVWVNLYTDTDVWEIVKGGNDQWTAKRNPHEMGRPMMEPLAYRPSLDRPFGKSRISRAVMSITDSAVRTALRTELSSEFYTAPQKVMLGVDESVFEDKAKWEAYIGNWIALGKDEDGDVPTVSQLAQYSMQPHTDYLRSLAARFSGETSIPVSELGIISDNPSSAEAIYAAKESLVIEAERLNESNGYALKSIGQMATACMMDKGLDDLTDDERSIQPVWRNPAMPSTVSQADAISKIVAVLPWIADSQVVLEEFGFNSDQITRLMNDKRKADANQTLRTLLGESAESDTEDRVEDNGDQQSTAEQIQPNAV